MTRPALSVLVAAGDDPVPLRATLDALWSEPPGVAVEVLVRAAGPAAAVVALEHARRARLLEAPAGEAGGRALEALLEAARARAVVVLAPGARGASGWARELLALGVGDDPPALVGPRLVGLAAGPQAGPQAGPRVDPQAGPQSGRAALRALALQVRFDEQRHAVADVLEPACALLPLAALEVTGGVDPRYETAAAAVTDLLRRSRAAGVEARVARRALVAAPALAPPSARDLALLARPAALLGPCPPVAVELEPDDPQAAALAALCRALLRRGVPVLTFSRGGRPARRPTPAPHVVAPGLDAPARAAGLLLVRAPAPAPARPLALPGEAAAPGALVLDDDPGDDDERLERWAAAVRAAIGAAT